MQRQCLVVWFAMSMLLVPAVASGAPRLPDPEKRSAVEQLMRELHDKQSITQFVGDSMVSCVATSPTTEICEWNLSARESGWGALARAIKTTYRIALLCELPTDGTSPAADACSAHPRRSNREDFRVRNRNVRKRRGQPASGIARTQRRYQEIARAWFADAKTLTDTSRLMGAAPDGCEPAAPGELRCVWKATSRTYGHGTAVMLIRASPRRKIRVTCVFPESGGPQSEECIAETGHSR